MPKHTLFVCQSCHPSEDHPDDRPADGKVLLEQVKAQLQSDALKVQPVRCLWDCYRACVVAFSATDKPTYLFSSLSTDETATALLEFGKLYRDRKTGNVPWKQFPKVLPDVSVAKIPAVGK
ncbi:MAG: DUF1636 family protein [Leptolyngbyaceae cyanobacterium SU_3_3]|nr:DUF1636 family protein [Leptolyngbyaceae cyanobacterium SU_3_3]